MAKQSGQIVIPTSSKDLSEFILKLLGKGNKIRRRILGNFAIRLGSLVDLHKKIDHRIRQQNLANMTSFETVLSFADGHSYTVQTPDELESYSPLLSDECNSVQMSWSYLVEFSGRTPERQQITVRIVADPLEPEMIRQEGISRSSVVYIAGGTRSGMTVTVEHTEVSFGYDLDNLIGNTLEKYIIPEKNGVLVFLRNNIVPITTLIVLFTFFFVYKTANNLYKNYLLSVIPKSQGNELQSISEKLDFIIMGARDYAIIYVLGIFAVASLLSFVSGWAIEKLTNPHRRSWIILNQTQSDAVTDFEKQTSRKQTMGALFLFGSVALTMFGQSVYDVVRFAITFLLGKA